jgi:hypothetical protein
MCTNGIQDIQFTSNLILRELLRTFKTYPLGVSRFLISSNLVMGGVREIKDLPIHVHLQQTISFTMESLQFHCLSTAVSLLSEEDFEKILLYRRIQVENTRLSEYLATCDQDFKAKASKIKAIYVLGPGGITWPDLDNTYIKELWCFIVARDYKVIGPEQEYDLKLLAWWHECKFGFYDRGWPKEKEDHLCYLTLTYKDVSGRAIISFPSGGWKLDGEEINEEDHGFKARLKDIAADLGLSAEDKNLLRLMEMLFTKQLVQSWGFDDRLFFRI